jgi:hypothetical protein
MSTLREACVFCYFGLDLVNKSLNAGPHIGIVFAVRLKRIKSGYVPKRHSVLET